jgi:flagellar biosynthesis/type III secretory pathway M-ring protein FliF/YscJ
MAPKNSDEVQVDVYPDMEWTADGGVWSSAPGALAFAQQGGEELDAVGLFTTYAPQAGLAALALVSLLMMMRMVRKSSEMAGPRGRLFTESAEGPEQDIPLTVGAGPVGEAEVSQSMLTGKEVDPQVLRFQELGSEVSKMVERDPEGAAALIRRWVEETQ